MRGVLERDRRRGLRASRVAALVLAATALCRGAARAQTTDATWVGGTSGDFDTGSNWSTGTAPTGTAFFGTFSPAGTANLTFSADTTIGGWTVDAGLFHNYTFTNDHILTFDNAGIAVDSGGVTITNDDAVVFENNSTAGTAQIANNAAATVTFDSGSSAGSSAITNASNATINFNGSSAGSTFLINANGGLVGFNGASTASSATIANNGILKFGDSSTAGGATITTNSGGSIYFFNSANGGTARFIFSGTGALDISELTTGGITAGSIEGDGYVLLGSNTLTVGGNDQSTTFSGVIADGGFAGSTGGSLTKEGTGTLTLTGANIYTGATTVNNGTLAISGSIASSAITNNSGLVYFGSSSAGSATITTNSGGITSFQGSASGGTARFIQNGTGALDISQLTTGSTTAGSIEGDGNVSLGAKTLTVGGNNLSTTFSGVIADGGAFGGTGGALTKEGTGTLTLTGVNTYTGATTVNAGVLALSGSLASSQITTNNVGTFEFLGTSTAGSSTITNGDFVEFLDSSSAGSATVTNNNGGTTRFEDSASGGTARFILNGTGALDISKLTSGSTATGSIEGDGNVFLGANTLTVGGNNLSTTFSGVIQDGGFNGGIGGSLTKEGKGTLTLTGANTYTGATTVSGGTLAVDGSIADTGSVTVNSGGTLAGTGLVDPPAPTTIMSGGTLAPGTPGVPGTFLTIGGNLVFQPGATYAITLNPTSTTYTVVTGTVSLAGTVNAVFLPGNYMAKQYDILHSDGGLSGAFSGVSMPNFDATLSDTANDVFLTLTAALGTGTPLNQNQQNVANAISNAFNSASSLPPSFASLFNLTGAPLANTLTQLDGEVATGVQQTTFDAMGQFMGLLTDPFMQRNGERGSASGTTGFADEEGASGYAANKRRDAFPMFTKAPPRVTFAQRWSVWTAGFVGSQSTDGNTVVGSNDTTSRIAGTAVGADYLFSPDTLAGFALAGGGTNFSVSGLGSGRSDLFQAGAYLRHWKGPAYISAALAYGWQDVTTDRSVTIAEVDRLRAEFNANAWSGRLEGGYRFVAPFTGGIGLTPYAAAQFTTLDLPAYAEQVISGTSAFALDYAARSVTDTRTELGLRSDKSFGLSDGILTLRGRLALAHDYNPDRSIAATFQTLPGASFVVDGAAQAPDSALTTASLEMNWMNGWSAAATFEGEFSDNTRSYAGKGALRYTW